jgi:ADP-heptose:LPS heptosyltransferase
VLTTPVIRVLKKQLDYELHMLVKNKFEEVVIANPNLDKIHSFIKSPDEILTQLRSENFDFIIDLQKNYRSIRLRKQLKKSSISFPKVNAQKWLLVNLKIDRLPNVHIVDRYFEAVKPLNASNDGFGLDYFIPENEQVMPSDIDPVLKNNDYVGFVIGGMHFTKILPVEKVTAIIDKIELPVVILGGAEDKQRSHDILKKVSRKNVFDTCGKFNLNQSASLVQKASVIITNDTGLMHIAAAFKKPIISIWGNTVPEFGMFPYMPGRQDLSFISEVNGLKCRPCSKLGYDHCPKKHFRCMLDQDENSIAQKAMEFTQIKI